MLKTRSYTFKNRDGSEHPARAWRIGPIILLGVRLKNFQEIK